MPFYVDVRSNTASLDNIRFMDRINLDGNRRLQISMGSPRERLYARSRKVIATSTETPQASSTTLSRNFAALTTSSSATSIATTSVVQADASISFLGGATGTGTAPLVDSSSSLSGGAIAGIAVGAAIVVLGASILLGFLLFFQRAKARTGNEIEAIEREFGHGRVPSYSARGELEQFGRLDMSLSPKGRHELFVMPQEMPS